MVIVGCLLVCVVLTFWWAIQTARDPVMQYIKHRDGMSKQARERLRCMPYKKYLKTKHWRLLRAAALYIAAGRCQECKSKHRLECHHKTYKRKGAERLEDIQVLCRSCHQKKHDGK